MHYINVTASHILFLKILKFINNKSEFTVQLHTCIKTQYSAYIDLHELKDEMVLYYQT